MKYKKWISYIVVRLILILSNLSSSPSDVHQVLLSRTVMELYWPGLYVCRRQGAVCLSRGWCNANYLSLASGFGWRPVFWREVTSRPRVPGWTCAFVFGRSVSAGNHDETDTSAREARAVLSYKRAESSAPSFSVGRCVKRRYCARSGVWSRLR